MSEPNREVWSEVDQTAQHTRLVAWRGAAPLRAFFSGKPQKRRHRRHVLSALELTP
jgi:hypothetical protein